MTATIEATAFAADRVKVKRRRRRIRGSSIAILVFLTMCAAFVSVPLYVVIMTSFKTMDQIAQGQIFSLPTEWTLEPWRYAWSQTCAGMTCNGVSAGFWTSLKILFPSLLLSIGVSSVTGYALALWKINWAGTFLFILFLCAFVPFQIIMIPLVVLVSSLGIFGTIWAVAVVHAILSMPLLTLIFRNFYKDIPDEIIKAAIMDCGSFWKIFLEIILPMSANIMIVVLILMITSVWNDYLIGLTFGGVGTQPMTVILANTVITSFGEVRYNVNMAAALLTAIPPLVVYFGLGKFFVEGITAGAIKG
ncbi:MULTISPECIES: carbohydrate ABC transporter permease [Rhizobium/Agrobacterium group]|uniref:Carbohydrate ABC transporter permease n=2 Tax=Neorhizobium TaxID=1525371 RepID=A0ABV0M4A3_9HYPH|nr:MULTISPECIES: carbohydrate ABC transporter permease [Rhizobium/Agrobacterium group]KGE02486.1 sugar ABC transporter permease [Rhizobium sp. YS-1r]MCC2613631.1 carbohydrate ABC transporter permease [Neorhizobium petrolearium]WGI71947.1 carbohydrate ABC transporter permease [Neorhizobium petrolearium]